MARTNKNKSRRHKSKRYGGAAAAGAVAGAAIPLGPLPVAAAAGLAGGGTWVSTFTRAGAGAAAAALYTQMGGAPGGEANYTIQAEIARMLSYVNVVDRGQVLIAALARVKPMTLANFDTLTPIA